jgi:4-diphosphocytidyl-2-C-methyl-D-erythritol kinase
VLCPAKINLGLQIHHRRPADGYHYLSSIFIPIDFGDTLVISDLPGDLDRLSTINELPPEIRADFEAVSERAPALATDFVGTPAQPPRTDEPAVIVPTANLVWRALAATRHLRDRALQVELTKRVPTGGGLGGGSSDAGTLLAYIRDRWEPDRDVLLPIAAALGADVPFFLHGQPALLHGTGDISEALEIGPGMGVLCFPLLKIETGIAYSRLKRTLQPGPPPRILSGLRRDVRDAVARSEWRAVRELVNDFEQPVFAMYPALGQVKESFLSSGAVFASMSGSGSSLYGLTTTRAEQEQLLKDMQAQFPRYRFQPFQWAGTGDRKLET